MIKSVIIVVLAIFSGCLLYYLVKFPKPHQVIGSIEQLKDSINRHNRVNDSIKLSIAHTIKQRDSAQVSLKKYIESTPKMQYDINKRYETKRNHIDSLPADEQVRFFAEWLSQDTATR